MDTDDRSRAELGPGAHDAALRRVRDTSYDVLVVGGGVTGAGVCLDAATRGLRVALVEKRDWAAGTSSRSGKLIHGGLRYLERLDVGLVRESLRERGLLLRRLAPHLLRPIRFVYPLRHRVWERAYIGAGLVLYDVLGGAGAVPRHRHLSRAALRRLAPGLDTSTIVGGLTFYDAQVDDARHTLELVRTAAAYGADVVRGLEVVALDHEGERVVGAQVRDQDSGTTFPIRARHVVNATGAWASRLDELAGGSPEYAVQASKGVHLMVPRDRISSDVSMFVRAEDSVLFVRSWGAHWLIGTTDTPWGLDLDEPRPTREDVEYLLRNVNRVLRTKLTREDVDGVFAGLRPLVVDSPTARTSKVSREHTVETVVPGYTSVVGGKYTTYRVMAEDTVDEVVRRLGDRVRGCRTADVPLLGAQDRDGARRLLEARGLPLVDHLAGRYGGLARDLVAMIDDDPDLAQPVSGAPGYLGVEIAYAASHEDARSLEDVLVRRTHIAIETPDRGLAAAPHVAAILAPVLGWDGPRVEREVAAHRAEVAQQRAAEQAPDDVTATTPASQSLSQAVSQEAAQ